MDEFVMEGKELDTADFADAMEYAKECEKSWFKLGLRLGRWKPTRQEARDATQMACWALENVDALRRMLHWVITVGFAMLLGLIALAAIVLPRLPAGA